MLKEAGRYIRRLGERKTCVLLALIAGALTNRAAVAQAPTKSTISGVWGPQGFLTGTTNERTQLIVAAARYRADTSADSLRIGFCNAAFFGGDSALLTREASAAGQANALFDRARGCAGISEPAIARVRLSIDSLRLGAREAKMYLQFRHGSNQHHETVSLTRQQSGGAWRVTGLVTWGSVIVE